eukprot:TRINITY_DN2827_c0_g1_i6.p1 TRINITY_DN2827_c0_g1~~TRINITY_DN2827_c0_g1_i6.p1  ORF type:complete len:235 (-),score=96.10 TRINITY_DN2827_c0_g1_i6:154-858(-)
MLAQHKKKLINQTSIEQLFTLAYKVLLDGDENEMKARQYLRQALILQYCTSITNNDGLYWFFKRLAARDNNHSKQVFESELEERFFTIKQSVNKKLEQLKEKQKKQIEEADMAPEEKERALVFQTLPNAMQKALEDGDDAALNTFLSSIPAEEAKRIVEKCEKYGIISTKEEPSAELQKVLNEIPPEVKKAIEDRDLQGLNTFLKTLDQQEAQAIIRKCQDVGLLSLKSNNKDL